jgi:hypothetical protein
MQANDKQIFASVNAPCDILWDVHQSQEGVGRGLGNGPTPALPARGAAPRSLLHNERDDRCQSWYDICYWHDVFTTMGVNRARPWEPPQSERTFYRRHRECAQCTTKYLPRACRCPLCNNSWYCSKACQRTHWRQGNHRWDCAGATEIECID